MALNTKWHERASGAVPLPANYPMLYVETGEWDLLPRLVAFVELIRPRGFDGRVPVIGTDKIRAVMDNDGYLTVAVDLPPEHPSFALVAAEVARVWDMLDEAGSEVESVFEGVSA